MPLGCQYTERDRMEMKIVRDVRGNQVSHMFGHLSHDTKRLNHMLEISEDT